MKKSLYICNAKQLDRVTRHTYDLAYSLVSKGNSFGCLATKIQGVRSLFVQTKLVRQMPNNNKQATKAKNSNLLRNSIFYALAGVGLPLLIADADSTAILLLTKVAGIAPLALAGTLHNRWYGNDLSEYYNEFFPNRNDR